MKNAMIDIPRHLKDRLLHAIEGTIILSPSQFRFVDGPVMTVADAPGAELGSDESARANLLAEAIWPYFYQNVYAKPGSTSLAAPVQPVRLDAEFVGRLIAANRSLRHWLPMWKVYELRADGAVWIQKGDCYRLALPGQYAFLSAAHRLPRLGEWVELLAQNESHDLEAGFFLSTGKRPAAASMKRKWSASIFT